MELHYGLLERRTIHHFSQGAVPEDVLERALAAAHMAPNHKHTWPWRFIVPGPVTREQVVSIGVSIKASKKELTVIEENAIRTKLTAPGALVVVVQRLEGSAFTIKEDYASCACAIQNLQLSAFADGFGTKWSTGGLTRHPDTYALFGLNPSDDEIVGFVWVGVPKMIPDVKRPVLSALMTRMA